MKYIEEISGVQVKTHLFNNSEFCFVFFRMILLICLIFGFTCVRAEGNLKKPSCLVFSKDQHDNKVEEFKKIYLISPETIVYSTAFDLDGDGNSEYLYYVDDIGGFYCGAISNQVGCPLDVVKYIDGSFVFSDDSAARYLGRNFKAPQNLRNAICTSQNQTQTVLTLTINTSLKGHRHEIKSYPSWNSLNK